VLARKSEWLRNACLAAALLFPAVAAVHGIILAILHNDGESSACLGPAVGPLLCSPPVANSFAPPF